MNIFKKLFAWGCLPVVLVALPGGLWAGPKEEKQARQARRMEARAEGPEMQVKPAHDPASPWHEWTNAKGESLKGKYLGLESGMLSVEDEKGERHRFPVSLLREEDA